MRERRPLPAKFAEAPEVPFGLELYLDAFWELTTCRPVGFGVVGPIPWTAILEYARAYGFDETQSDDLVYYTKVLDMAFLGLKAKESERRWQSQTGSNSSPGA